jgi:hypothetical protein
LKSRGPAFDEGPTFFGAASSSAGSPPHRAMPIDATATTRRARFVCMIDDPFRLQF